MGYTAFSLAIMAVTFVTLRGGWRSPNGWQIAGMDAAGLGMGALAVGAAVFFFGPLYGLAFVLSIAVHEFGHVAAYRVCGHSDATFRLIPLMGGVAISRQLPASQEHQAFISIMGPAICIGPMLLGFSLGRMFYDAAPMFADFCLIFGMVTGALNFFNLLPFWPLDGGRILHVVAASLWPPAALVVATMMSAALIVAAIAMKSMILVFFALLGAQSLLSGRQVTDAQRRMGRARALLVLAAYVATLGAFGLGGATFLTSWL
jgi:Zn-dependent protease